MNGQRWQLLEETSPSGRTLFRCGVCGRVSSTPDKRCAGRNCHETTLEATTEALRLAVQELVYLHDETPDDYADRTAAAWDAARSALAAAPVGRYTRKEEA